MADPNLQKYVDQGIEAINSLKERRAKMRQKRFDTIAVHGVYGSEAMLSNQGSVIEPMFLSSSQHFENSDHLEAGLAYMTPAWAYTRVTNPSMIYLEETLALLESYQTNIETSALVTSSGMSAVFMATNPLLANFGHSSDGKVNIVVSAKCYGGSFMLINERYKNERGIDVRWVKNTQDINEWSNQVDENTRFIYGEMPSNPSLSAFDIAELSKLAKQFEIPLIVDATLATPALCRPIAHGADIVIHSASKSMSASGFSIAGAIISKQNINCKYAGEDLKADYATYLKLNPARDFGAVLSPFNALMTLNDLRTIRSRIKQMSDSSMQVAKFLEAHPMVDSVNYPGLESCESHQLCKKYMQLVDSGESLYGHLLSFTVKSGANAAREVLDTLDSISIATDLGRVKSIATIPSISTHQQQGADGRELANITDNLIRLSIGLESPDDLIQELDTALKQASVVSNVAG